MKNNIWIRVGLYTLLFLFLDSQEVFADDVEDVIENAREWLIASVFYGVMVILGLLALMKVPGNPERGWGDFKNILYATTAGGVLHYLISSIAGW